MGGGGVKSKTRTTVRSIFLYRMWDVDEVRRQMIIQYPEQCYFKVLASVFVDCFTGERTEAGK